MNLNPRDYDPNELRSLRDGRSGRDSSEEFSDSSSLRARFESLDVAAEADARRPQADRELRASQLERLFFLASAARPEARERPYLDALPETELGERLVVDWLEFLVDRGGRTRAAEALAYYHSVDWLSEAVEVDLRNYLAAFPTGGAHVGSLGVEDHRLSLLYVAKLATLA